MKLASYLKGALLALILVALGCGGGSSGTGTTTVEGTVRSTRGETPLVGATVTLAQTGEAAVTDSLGRFLLITDALKGDVELLIESDEAPDEQLSSSVLIEDVDIETTSIRVEIEIDIESEVATAISLQVRAKIVGICDIFFENTRTIRQSGAFPQGTICTAEVRLTTEGISIPRAPILIQYRACPEDSEWINTAMGETEGDGSTGIGLLDFLFFDDFDRCVYRILAPADVEDLEAVVYEIHTFTKQSYDEVNLPARDDSPPPPRCSQSLSLVRRGGD